MRAGLRIGCIGILIMLLCMGASIALAEDIYLAPSGSDAAAGTANAPMQTLEAAMARLRGLEGDGAVTLWLAEGEYALTQTLSLTGRDRGNVVIRAMPGAEVAISGAKRVENWNVIERNGQVIWRAEVKDAPNALYGASGTLQSARWPKTGMLEVKASIGDVSTKFAQHRAFLADPALLPSDLTGARVRLLHAWRDELSGVKAYRARDGRITMNRYTSMTPFPGDTFWLENVLHAPFEPGEWAFDAAEGALYYAPLPNESPDTTALHLGAQTRLITIDGLSKLTFMDLHFTQTDWVIPHRDSEPDFAQAAYDADAAIFIRNAQDIAFINCRFTDMGAGCIRLDTNVQDVFISRCTFRDIGAHALFVHGKNADNRKVTQRIVLEDCEVDGYGRNYLNAAALLIVHARDVRIAYNEIHDGTYTAISAGWVWGTGFQITDHIAIEHNLIYDIGQGLLSDMGGVYLLGVQPNTYVSGNVITRVNAAEYGGWGIYLDEGASGITVTQNLVYDCSHQGFHQHNGVYNLVHNNILAFNRDGQVGASDKRAGGSFLLKQNILAGSEPLFYRKYGVEAIDMEANVIYIEDSPFLPGGFELRENSALDDAGFVGWEMDAGRRQGDAVPLDPLLKGFIP